MDHLQSRRWRMQRKAVVKSLFMLLSFPLNNPLTMEKDERTLDGSSQWNMRSLSYFVSSQDRKECPLAPLYFSGPMFSMKQWIDNSQSTWQCISTMKTLFFMDQNNLSSNWRGTNLKKDILNLFQKESFRSFVTPPHSMWIDFLIFPITRHSMRMFIVSCSFIVLQQKKTRKKGLISK